MPLRPFPMPPLRFNRIQLRKPAMTCARFEGRSSEFDVRAPDLAGPHPGAEGKRRLALRPDVRPERLDDHAVRPEAVYG